MTEDEFRRQLHVLLKQVAADQGQRVRSITVDWMGPFYDAPHILGMVDVQFHPKGSA